jgi:hypothetical protein
MIVSKEDDAANLRTDVRSIQYRVYAIRVGKEGKEAYLQACASQHTFHTPPSLSYHNRSVAVRAPSTIEASFAQVMSGSTVSKPAKVAKPQSVPAMTFSRPTTEA